MCLNSFLLDLLFRLRITRERCLDTCVSGVLDLLCYLLIDLVDGLLFGFGVDGWFVAYVVDCLRMIFWV